MNKKLKNKLKIISSKRFGFTLIELLAVIILLSIIALISTIVTINIIEAAKKEAFRDTAYGLASATKNYMMENMFNNSGSFEEKVFSFPNDIDGLNFQGESPIGGAIKLNKNGKIEIAVYNKKWCALKSYDESKITIIDGICPGYENTEEDDSSCPLGSMHLTLFYPDGATNEEWRLGIPGEVRSSTNNDWQEYTGPICVKLTEVENIWIRYLMEDQTNSQTANIIVPPNGELLVNINYKKTADQSGTVTIDYDNDATTKEYRVGDSRWLPYTGSFTITENTTIYARAKKNVDVKDEDGNIIASTEVTGYDIYQISYLNTKESDETLEAPTINLIETEDVPNAEIIYPDIDGIQKIYKLNLGEEQNYTNVINDLNWGTTIKAYYYTSDGRKSLEATKVLEKEPDKLDVDIIANPEPASVTDLDETTVTIMYDERSDVDQYQIDDESLIDYDGSFKVNSDCVIKAYASNDNGTGQTTKNIVFKKSALGEPNISVAYNEDKTIATVNIIYDETVGITKKYSINGGELLDYNNSFEVTKNGTTIYAENEDSDGNVKSSSYTITGLNTIEKPTIDITYNDNKTIATVNITYDEISGVTKKYSINSGELLDYSTSFEVTENGTTVYAENEDSDGNKESASLIITGLSELQAPTINHNLGTENDKVTIDIAYDETVGITKKYSIDGGELLDYTGPFDIYKNGTVVYAENEDTNGNILSQTYTVTGILEISKPTINVIYNENKTVAIVNIVYDEAHASNKKYSINGGELLDYSTSFEVTENGTVIYAENSDADGNSENATITINGLAELQAPNIKASYAEEGKAIITIDYDEIVGITKKYSINGGELLDYSAPFDVTENGTVIYAESQDSKGNILSQTYTVTGIVNKLDVEILVNPDTTETISEATITINYDTNATTKQYQINGGAIVDYTGPFTINSKSTIKAIAKGTNDAYGEAIKSISNFADGLNNPNITYTTDLRTSGGIANEVATVSINYDSNATIKKYSINNGGLLDYTGPFEVSENGTTIYAYSADDFGYYSSADLTIDSLKNFKYVEYEKYFVLKLNYPTNSINREYKYSTNDWKDYQEKGFVLLKNEYIDDFNLDDNLILEDDNGNLQDYTGDWYVTNTNDFNLLQDDIYMRWEYKQTDNPENIAKQSLQILPFPVTTDTDRVYVLIIPEADSTLTQYRINGGDWTTYNSLLTITENNTKVEARSLKDDATWTDVKEYTITNIIAIPDSNPYNSEQGVNRPQLAEEMTPIKWVGGVETETTEYDPDWYSYNNKLWANAKTADGSYWVWIPRYAYKISSGWHTNTAGTIDIVFLKNNTTDNDSGTTIYTSGYDITGTNTSNSYFLEPAFQNETGNTEYGFWVAKFEMSNSSASPKSIPNVSSLRNITTGNMFTYSQNMASNSSYGWTNESTDTHMMTNYEWGAVAYLSKSIYGKNNEIWINNSSTHITGCAGSSVSSSSYSGCQYAYNTSNGMNASTTGNITGIYDMSGGSMEHVAAYVNNNNSNLANGSSIINSTINKNVYSIGTTDTQANDYNANKNIYGDALYETSSSYGGITSWNSDYSDMSYSSSPWFDRGGRYANASNAGIFAFISNIGGFSTDISFRVVCSIKQ